MAIEAYKKAHGYDSFAFRKDFPWLDSLQDLIADWMTAGYLDRSAYQAMSSLHGRVARRPEDLVCAMIGALTPDAPSAADLALPAPEYFMQVCERKGDFSFIYSSAPRSDVSGRRWRPAVGPLPALLPWHSWGDGQTGRLQPNCVDLDLMYRCERGSVSPEAREFVQSWLESERRLPSGGDLVECTLERLRLGGFSGVGRPIELRNGYFLPQRPINEWESFEVFVAVGIRWVHGAPGLVVSTGTAERVRCLEVGVFVGQVPTTGWGTPRRIKRRS
jgi:hypothetical protein